jgi:hypothetical protein
MINGFNFCFSNSPWFWEMTESTHAVPSIMNARIDVLSLEYIHSFLRAFTRSVLREIDDWDILMSKNRIGWPWCKTLGGTPPCSSTQRVRSGRRFWEDSVRSNDIMFSQSHHFCANWENKPFNQPLWRRWNIGFYLVSTGLRTNFKESMRKCFANRNQSRRSETHQNVTINKLWRYLMCVHIRFDNYFETNLQIFQNRYRLDHPLLD